MSTILLALDPSIRALGWAILADEAKPRRLASGTFKPSEAKDQPDRFAQLGDFVRALIAEYEVSEAVVETPGTYQQRHIAALIPYLRAVGVCEDAPQGAGCAVHKLTVNQWKGTGSKQRTRLHVVAELRYQPASDDESDALGLGLWHLYRQRSRIPTVPSRPAKQRVFAFTPKPAPAVGTPRRPEAWQCPSCGNAMREIHGPRGGWLQCQLHPQCQTKVQIGPNSLPVQPLGIWRPRATSALRSRLREGGTR